MEEAPIRTAFFIGHAILTRSYAVRMHCSVEQQFMRTADHLRHEAARSAVRPTRSRFLRTPSEY